jgi:hypothetical protein
MEDIRGWSCTVKGKEVVVISWLNVVPHLSAQICTYDAKDVFGLLNSHDQDLIIDHHVEILKQNSPEEAGKPKSQDSVNAMNVSSIKCGNFLTSWGPVSFGKDSALRSYVCIYVYVCMYVCKGTCYLWHSTKDSVVTAVAGSHIICFLGVSAVDIFLITCIRKILHYMHPDLRH